MGLYDRAEAARLSPGPQPAAPRYAVPSPDPAAGASWAPRDQAAPEPVRLSERLPTRATVPARVDALGALKSSAVEALFEKLGARITDPDLDETALRALVVTELNQVVEDAKVPLSSTERQRLMREVLDDVLGVGPLQPLIDDPSITEVMVNGPDKVYIERAGKLQRVDTFFEDEAHLRRIIERIVTRVGRRIDEASPLVDARLEDGSRVNAIIPPLAVSGSTLTIRKFSHEALSVPDLIQLGTMSTEMADLLDACVRARLNIIVSGGTGTGKTTLLNVLSSFLPSDERIVTIEDAVELQLQ